MSSLIRGSDYSSLTPHLLELGDFMSGAKCERETQEVEESAQAIALFDLSVIPTQDFATRLENKEPCKTLCLAFLNIYSSLDPDLPPLWFGSKAVKFMQAYLTAPQKALNHIRNTPKYLHNRQLHPKRGRIWWGCWRSAVA